MSNQHQNQLSIFDLVAYEAIEPQKNNVKFYQLHTYKKAITDKQINRVCKVFTVSNTYKTIDLFLIFDYENRSKFNLVLDFEFKDVMWGFEDLEEYGLLFSSEKEAIEYLETFNLKVLVEEQDKIKTKAWELHKGTDWIGLDKPLMVNYTYKKASV